MSGLKFFPAPFTKAMAAKTITSPGTGIPEHAGGQGFDPPPPQPLDPIVITNVRTLCSTLPPPQALKIRGVRAQLCLAAFLTHPHMEKNFIPSRKKVVPMCADKVHIRSDFSSEEARAV